MLVKLLVGAKYLLTHDSVYADEDKRMLVEYVGFSFLA